MAAAGALAAGAGAGAGARRTSALIDLPRPANLKLGTQHGDSDDILKVLAAFGVNHICALAPTAANGVENWSVDALTRKREHIESFGVAVDAMRLLYPTYIAKSQIRNVLLGKSPERDREIDTICQRIRNASRAGIPMLTYNLTILEGCRGVHRVLGTVGGLKRFVELVPSPFHGLNFCQGTVSESLKNPGQEIFDVIRYFGIRGKLFNVHFRNIKGAFMNFQETLPDNGDVNFVQAIRVYKEVGYDGMLMPDHVPQIEGDAGGRQAFAYCFGYIQALIQLVNQEA
jgi:D-mannonate dehydratase